MALSATIERQRQTRIRRAARRETAQPGRSESRLSAGGGAVVQQMRIKNASDYGDYIVCRTWDGTTEGGEDILVAKPYLLRRTPFEDVAEHDLRLPGIEYVYVSNIKRQAREIGNALNNETQVVVPRYVEDDVNGYRGDVIYAVKDIN